MPAKGKGKYQRLGQGSLRERYRDYNSQRRFRKQKTVSWSDYKRRTRGGRVQYSTKRK